jgi:hypothetical protein
MTVKPAAAAAVEKKLAAQVKSDNVLHAVSYTQENVLCAMLDHKLIWRRRDNACVLTCGEAPEKRVRRTTVQTLLNQRLVLGPLDPTAADKPKFDYWYKLSETGRALALALA